MLLTGLQCYEIVSILPDPTLTLDNLLSVLESVTDWVRLGSWLDVPTNRLSNITGMESLLQEWLTNHPAPMWRHMAWALYRLARSPEHGVLKQLYGTYLTGMFTG